MMFCLVVEEFRAEVVLLCQMSQDTKVTVGCSELNLETSE